MFSIDFFEISSRIVKNDFESLGIYIAGVAKNIEDAGADCIVICANTLHMFEGQILEKISIPFIHIADATALKIKERGMKKVALLGTQPTMEMPFYKNRLKEKHEIEVIIPNGEEVAEIHKIITAELLHSIFKPESKAFLLSVIDKMAKLGAEAVILGCTDFPLLISQNDTKTILLDTAEIHAKAAVEFAIRKNE
jgi:aspartate racemase